MAQEAVKEWNELQGIKPEEFNKRFETGEFDKFMNDQKFVEAHKSQKLFEQPQAQETQPAPEPESPKPAPAPAKDEPWYKTQGYESEAEYQESVTNMRGLLDKKQSQIDGFNAERGKIGAESKKDTVRLEKELADARKKLEEKPASSRQAAIEAPEMPILPVPEDGDHNSTEYQSQLRRYQEHMKDYAKKRKDFDSSVSGLHQKISATEQKLSELTGKTTLIESDSKASKADRQRELANKSWRETISEVAKLQDIDVSLKTSKSFEEINGIVKGRGYEEAVKLYPKKDIENFDRICDIIREYQHVDNSGNIDYTHPPKHRSIKAALYNVLDGEGKLDEYLHKIKTDGARQGREQVIDALTKQGDTARTLPSGGEEKTILEEMTETDLDKKLKEFSKPEYDTKLAADPVLRKEVYGLMMKASEKNPQWNAMIPPKWKDEFSIKK